jgi:3'-phosphoadenosine 5'-phosphosulfate sulfotransferase (PAPS reductase)/FAD synthetase
MRFAMANKRVDPKLRHICGISGGKDSSALAIYLRRTRPDLDIEYFFCDTGAELEETYEYLGKLEAVLGKPIVRLNAERDFTHYFQMRRGMLPSPQIRWCTVDMKIKPLERWVGDDQVISYVAIRADEKNRKGYVSTKPNITPMFPFKEEGITYEDVVRILDEAGIGLPSYYEWRTRSGCYFCFYQRKAEWVGLAELHPDLFEKAVAIEKKVLADAGVDTDADYREWASEGSYTWSNGETLEQLYARRNEIMAEHRKRLEQAKARDRNLPLVKSLEDALDADNDTTACTICAL